MFVAVQILCKVAVLPRRDRAGEAGACIASATAACALAMPTTMTHADPPWREKNFVAAVLCVQRMREDSVGFSTRRGGGRGTDNTE